MWKYIFVFTVLMNANPAFAEGDQPGGPNAPVLELDDGAGVIIGDFDDFSDEYNEPPSHSEVSDACHMEGSPSLGGFAIVCVYYPAGCVKVTRRFSYVFHYRNPSYFVKVSSSHEEENWCE